MGWTNGQQEALLRIIQRRSERTILLKQVDRTKNELAIHQQQQTVLRNNWQTEQADVDRLNRLSWASVWYDLLNRKEQQMSSEEAEAQQARLQYDTVCAAVNDLKQQHADLENRLATYAAVDTEYEQLIQEKRIAVSTSASEVGNRYQHYLAAFTQYNQYVQELDEAHKAGMYALDEVMQLRKLLDQARHWGTWDMLGGSTLSSLVKYEKLDDVRDQSYRVTRSLEKFRAEYADLHQAYLADWQFDQNITRFVDIFFDNIFTDWSVQSRIRTALQTAQALENQLVATLTTVKSQLEQAVGQTRQKADELHHFLENA